MCIQPQCSLKPWYINICPQVTAPYTFNYSITGPLGTTPYSVGPTTGNNASVHPRPGNAAEANILRYEMSGEQVKGYQNEVNAEYELAQVNVNTAEGDFEKQKEILFPENPEVAKRIQNFQKQAAPGEGGRRRNRNRKTKKHSRKH